MPHPPIHRGLAPEDQQLFAEKQLLVLRSAMRDLCWLLDRGYAARSCIELVGNRHTLSTRQRHALSRCICSQEEEQSRFRRCAGPEELCGNELWIDGYNVLTVLESALSGGIVLIGRDGCCRDIAGIHKRYRKVNETIPALEWWGTQRWNTE